jgi:hypothetical protein
MAVGCSLATAKAFVADRVREGWKSPVEGGLSDGMSVRSFDAESLAQGLCVELEHTSRWFTALRVTMDHLVEFPGYYPALERMESELRAARRAGPRARHENLDPTTAAVVASAIGATTTTTIQGLASNPRVRFLAAPVGAEVVVVKGMRKADALDLVEQEVGSVDRGRSRTFDTRKAAFAYANGHWGPVTRELGPPRSNPKTRAIKRRVLR